MAKKIPVRMCTGCAEFKNKKEMVRIVKTSDGNISLDKTGKQNGRGAYICNDTSCLNKAIKHKGLERSLKTRVPSEIISTLEKEMNIIEL